MLQIDQTNNTIDFNFTDRDEMKYLINFYKQIVHKEIVSLVLVKLWWIHV